MVRCRGAHHAEGEVNLAESRGCLSSYMELRHALGSAILRRSGVAVPVYECTRNILTSTAIGLRKYRIPSDLRSQAEYRLVSTMVGDHMGILGVVVFDFLHGYGEDR